MGRRTFLVAVGAAAVLVPVATILALGVSKRLSIPMVGDADAVTAFGAKADGVADDSGAFSRALASTGSIRIPAGTYLLKSTIYIEDDDTIVSAAPGVWLVSDLDNAVLNVRGASRFEVVGRGMTIDLNSVSSSALRVVADGDSRIQDVQISGVNVVNNLRGIDASSSAIEVRGASNVRVVDVRISDYGFEQDVTSEVSKTGKADAQVYGLGLFECFGVDVENIQITRACVGIEIQKCRDVSVRDFALTTGIDNGFYVLAGSSNITIQDGVVDAFEEGIVLLSPNVNLRNVDFIKCTNKGMTLRHTSNVTIEGCGFNGNRSGIGDDGSGRAVSQIRLVNCRFDQEAGRAIFLTTLSRSTLAGNSFAATESKVDQLIRLTDAKDVHVENNHFSGHGDDTNALLALYGAVADCTVDENTFVGGAVGVRIAATQSGEPTRVTLAQNKFDGEGVSPTRRTRVDDGLVAITDDGS